MARAGQAGSRVPPAPAVLGRIRLRHLQAFLAVAQEGSLQAAARSLSLSQPAVTKTLAELEAALGERLFDRGRHGATPTAAGEAFRPHAQASLGALRQALDSVARPEAQRTVLRLGLLPTLAPSLAPRVLQQWRAAWPGAALQVVDADNASLRALLQAGALDLVVGRLAEPEALGGLSFETLYAEPLVVAVAPGHPLAARAAVGPVELSAFPWVLPPRGTVIRHAADSFLAAREVRPAAGTVETLSMSLSRALLADGRSLWFTPASAVEDACAAGGLARLALPMTGTDEPVGLLRPAPGPEGDAPPLASMVRLLRDEGARRRALPDRVA